MDLRRTKLKSLKFSFIGLSIGLSIPLLFIFLDLKQLNLSLNFANTYDVFKSQNIYIFSTILFPLLFGIVALLYSAFIHKNKVLAEQEAYYKNILNSQFDCIIVTDQNGKIKYANQSFFNIYDYFESPIINLLKINQLSEVAEGKFFELMIKNKQNEERWIDYSIFQMNKTLIKKSSLENQFIISIRDIHELKKKQEIIENQTSQLFEASKLSALGEMASGFAHEINNPLAIISGRIMQANRELNKVDFNKEIVFKNLDACKETITRITKIISGLRNLSHAESDSLELATVNDLIQDAITMANLKMVGKGIKFNILSNELGNEVINCNLVQISQVLMNLLNNSIYEIESKENPWINFIIEKINNEIKFTVSDSGLGIPLEVQKKMFEPMYTTKPIGKGTGLGLSISRAIIEKHNGSLKINNNLPNTTFEVCIPLNLQDNQYKKIA
jgi:PAS domain S-box-containing protein